MSRIVTPKPPSALIDASRMLLTQSWGTLYTVPFFSDTLGVPELGVLGQADADSGAVLTFATAITASLIVANSSITDATFSARVFSGRMSTRAVTIVAQAGTNRLAFKGFGPQDAYGAALDAVKLIGTSGVNQIVNGSFEDVTGLTRTQYGYLGIGAIPGWTDFVATTRLDVHQDTRFGVVPADRSSWLDTRGSFAAVPGHPNGGNIHAYQDIGSLAAGTSYTLYFDYADDVDRGNLLEVYWNNQILTIDGQTRISPIIERLVARDVLVPPGDFVRMSVEKSLMASSDNFQLRAEGDFALAAHLSLTLKTAEAFTIL